MKKKRLSTHRGIILAKMEEIEKLRESGLSLEDTFLRLKNDGVFDIVFATFRYHYYRIKQISKPEPELAEKPREKPSGETLAKPSGVTEPKNYIEDSRAKTRALFEQMRNDG